MAEPATLTRDARPLPDGEDVRALVRRRGEPEALAERRLAALAAYRDAAWPDRVRHLWKFTDPAALLPASLTPAAPRDGAPAEGEPAVVLAGGEARLNEAARALEIQIAPLARAGAELDRLGAAVPAGHGLFEALNAALWSDGLLVRIPRRTVLGQALRVVVPAAAGCVLPRLLVIAETGAEATVVEEHAGGGADARVFGVTEAFVAPGASLRHVVVQRWAPRTAGHLTFRARLERDASLLTAVASFGGAVAKLDLGATLEGEGARSEMVGVALGEGRQQLDHHTVHAHLAGRTWSNLDFKVALTGRARSAYTGLIRIEPGAPRSEAYQENRNLLLADGCRADTIPELEILTDEVSCTHGATVAPVDPEHLFYLRSRGIPPAAALQLVVRGFLENTLRRLPESLRAGLEPLLAERLARLAEGA